MSVKGLVVGSLLAMTPFATASESNYWCPVSCEEAGRRPENWTRYTSMKDLLSCDEKSMLLDFSIHTALDESKSTFVVFACSYERGVLATKGESTVTQNLDSDSGLDALSVKLDRIYAGSDSALNSNDTVTAAGDMQSALAAGNQGNGDDNTPISIVLQYGETVIGAFVGSGIDPRGTALLLDELVGRIQNPGTLTSNTFALQLCGKSLTADHTMGVISDATPGKALYRVQTAMKAWWDAGCTDLPDTTPPGSSMDAGNSTIWLTKNLRQAFDIESSSEASLLSTNATTLDIGDFRAKGTCRTRTVVSGDSCGSLAKKCGISAAKLAKYNPSKKFCSTLAVGQSICCSSGTLPDKRPKPHKDGSCASYVVKRGDFCSTIAAKYGLTVAKLESFNKKTWGWAGCDSLLPAVNMCLSKGTPALPGSIKDAVCGPQKPGTKKPSAGTDMAKLNPCPLNACCNVWGKCGTTAEFCTVAPAGNPGTTKPGKSSCISNCGTSIVNNKVGPDEFKKIGYFEAWNDERPCLTMDISEVPQGFTHLHFAFGDIGPSFSVSIAKARDQFEKFVKLSGVKRVVAFGGWTASTDPSSYWIIREGVKSANRKTLANNIVKFAKDNKLDGIDIDWEYPGAPDIGGIPAGDPLDGKAYLELLKLIKAQLPKSMTLSIAIPSSYWYLKPFPMADIAKVVDYMVYMTYDLHGQWDYNSKWSMPGCPEGKSCMRSHVNMTETMNSLAMLTKAGVNSAKIVVGVTSYGRSFRMTDSKCKGTQCGFAGPESQATKGRCTDTAGYISNTEIVEIIGMDQTAKVSYDKTSKSNILEYGPSNARDWVAYMDDDNKADRITLWKGLNFGGTSDWAVDLGAFVSGADKPWDPNDPDSKPGNFLELPQDFRNYTCDNKYWENSDSLYTDVEQWEYLRADEAWRYVLAKWRGRPSTNSFNFVTYISRELDGPENLYCSVLSDANNCGGPIECDVGNKTPAATMILMSIYSFNAMMTSFYTGIVQAHSTMDTELQRFADTFAPREEPDPLLNWLLDFVGAGFGLAAGPAFSRIFKASKYFEDNPGHGDTIQGTVMDGVGFGLKVAKEHLPSRSENHWKKDASELQRFAFDGKVESIKFLDSMIRGGKIMNITPPSFLDNEEDVLYILYAYLIQYAWSLRGYNPVLVKTKWKCDGSNMDDVEQIGIDPDDDDMAGICVDGVKYFLLYPDGKAKKCESESESHWTGSGGCYRHNMNVLPGMSALGARKGKPDQDNSDKFTGTYGGITRKQIAKAILMRYDDSGNADLSKPISDDRDTLWGYIEGGHGTLLGGLFKIPTCGVDEVWSNWLKNSAGDDAPWPSYPCNKETKKR